MIYLNEDNLKEIGVNWGPIIDVIEDAVVCLDRKDFSQPIKPYLRYNDLKNRIIAMPAFAGGAINKSGIKWIASFPDNIHNGIPRANSVSIINEADTGVPVCIINATFISAIRTAGVTGLILKKFVEKRSNQKEFSIGMTGFGPIGQLHLDMLFKLLGSKLKTVKIFDLRPIDESIIPEEYRPYVKITDSWEEAYEDADVFVTCTVSKASYIDKKPKKGSAHLNVSLRDYKPETKPYFDQIIVDDWDEVCRESTDIEVMHLQEDLKREQSLDMTEYIIGDKINELKDDETLMFNPMGLAVFDIAVGNYYYQEAKKQHIGTFLN